MHDLWKDKIMLSVPIFMATAVLLALQTELPYLT